MTKSYILAARRSAVATRNGHFANLSLHALAAPVVAHTLQDAGLSTDQVGEIIVSNALGAGGNPARIVALASRLPQDVAGLSIDRQCAGGLDALLIADAMVRSGLHDTVIAGGVESYSRRPLRYQTFPDGTPPEQYEQAPFTPWPERDPDMAQAADHLAHSLNIPQEEQDQWAIRSHQNARLAALETQHNEIVEIAGLAHDTFTRDLTLKHCTRAKTLHGTITSANMAVAADAAGFVIVASEKVARNMKGNAIEIIAGKTIGGNPEMPGTAPVKAIKTMLNQTGTNPADLQEAEIMEAFAVQAIACQRGAALPPEIVNKRGGALARGHPIGASGAILAIGLFHALRGNPGAGIAAIAAAGGLGTALMLRTA